MVNRTLCILMLLLVLCASNGCLVIGTMLLIKRINDRQTSEKGTTVDMQVQSSSDGVRSSGPIDGNDEQQASLLTGGRESTCRDTIDEEIQESVKNDSNNQDE